MQVYETAEIAAQVARCPSGALKYRLKTEDVAAP
jgi:uncharacterized Fe-S cluster protein YjdI